MLVTTSRYASKATRDFAKKLANGKPKSRKYVARGKKTVASVASLAWKKGYAKVIIIEESSKQPSAVAELLIDAWGKWKWGKRNEIERKDRD